MFVNEVADLGWNVIELVFVAVYFKSNKKISAADWQITLKIVK